MLQRLGLTYRHPEPPGDFIGLPFGKCLDPSLRRHWVKSRVRQWCLWIGILISERRVTPLHENAGRRSKVTTQTLSLWPH